MASWNLWQVAIGLGKARFEDMGADGQEEYRHQRLAECEAVIRRGLETFIEVGQALLEIREGRLYRTEFATFDAYLEARWPELGSCRRAYQLMNAAQVVSNLNSCSEVLPANEAQARPLTGLPVETQRQAWLQAIDEASDRPITAGLVKAVADRYRAPEPTTLAADIVLPPPCERGIPDELVQWVETGTGRVREGLIEAVWGNTLRIRPTDGGHDRAVHVTPDRLAAPDPAIPPTPFGRCGDCGTVLTARDWQDLHPDLRVCDGCLERRVAQGERAAELLTSHAEPRSSSTWDRSDKRGVQARRAALEDRYWRACECLRDEVAAAWEDGGPTPRIDLVLGSRPGLASDTNTTDPTMCTRHQQGGESWERSRGTSE
jgi:hypothetical protein